MKYVIGIDLGTSSVKAILVNGGGVVYQSISEQLPLIHEKSGYSEQNPEQWYSKTKKVITKLLASFKGDVKQIEGISFSGQMHGLVLLDKNLRVLRNAILWNDTRTKKQCLEINNLLGEEKLIKLTKNKALEGFTLPKLLWVKENEKDIFKKTKTFLLPKDYLRYRITGKIHTDYSDAAGTLLFEVDNNRWSDEICKVFDINKEICPPLLESHDYCGSISSEFAKETGLLITTKVFTGAADNACGAIGAGVISEGKTLCSIGTSGVILAYVKPNGGDYGGKLHYFNHGIEKAYYNMGVTLSAGYSLNWFQNAFNKTEPLEELLKEVGNIPVGSNGLLFTPYLVGERTPHSDSTIRASFIGIDSSHSEKHFIRAIMEGVTYSLKESLDIFIDNGNKINSIISVGGGAKSEIWLQMQADIFNIEIVKLSKEQGPALGAAILAAYGCGWYNSLEECTSVFISYEKSYKPIKGNVERYSLLYDLYKTIYLNTKDINEKLMKFRNH